MRIAYLVNQYPSVSHTFIRREIRALEALGHEVTRYSIRPVRTPLVDEADHEERLRTRALLEAPHRIPTAVAKCALKSPTRFAHATRLAVELGHGSERGLAVHAAYLGEACRLVEELRDRPADHVHAHFGTNPAAVAALAHALGGPTFSFTAHGPEEFDRAHGLMLRAKIREAAFVVGVSSFGRSQLLRHTDADSWDKVHVVHCGVDQGYLAPSTPVPDTTRFVCVGRLSEQKGQAILIGAAAQLERDGVDFEVVLVGDGELRRALERSITREKIEHRIRITGWASGAEVAKAIESARAFVLPSFAEGLPVVIMEALARGRPVISTYIAGIPELVKTGTNGWLVPAGSVEELAKAMREALATPTSRLEEMGLAGRARVAEVHDVARSARELATLFDRYARREGSL